MSMGDALTLIVLMAFFAASFFFFRWTERL